VANEKSDEVHDFFRLRWATEWNTDDRFAALIVGAGLHGQTFGERDSGFGFGFNPARRDADHAYAFGR
jgi:hypothetical protein